jgi:hypothetical protein
MFIVLDTLTGLAWVELGLLPTVSLNLLSPLARQVTLYKCKLLWLTGVTVRRVCSPMVTNLQVLQIISRFQWPGLWLTCPGHQSISHWGDGDKGGVTGNHKTVF